MCSRIVRVASEERRAQAKHLIRWCLQGDPSNRPSFEDDFEASVHSIVGYFEQSRDASSKTEEKSSRPSISKRSFTDDPLHVPSQDMRYHFFISHMQAEASGDVGTMYHLFANMGINCWYVFMLIDRMHRNLNSLCTHTGAT